MSECWAGFGCYEETMCCDTISCQGPAPLILIIFGACLVVCAVISTMVAVMRRRRQQQQRLAKLQGDVHDTQRIEMT